MALIETTKDLISKEVREATESSFKVTPHIQLRSVFDECGDDYEPDLSFVKEKDDAAK